MKASEAIVRGVVRNALWLRLAAALLSFVFLPLGTLAPDETTYDIRGDYLARYWRGDINYNPAKEYLGEGIGYYYVVAVMYLPAGSIPLIPRCFNAWLGSLAVLELFRLTRLIGGNDSAALRAAKFMAYFPSMILWSSVMVRDVFVQYLLVRMAREMAELKGRFVPSRVLTVAILIWALTQFRSYLVYAAVGPLILSFVLSRSRDVIRNLVFGSILALALSYLGVQGADSGVKRFDLEEMQKLRQWSSSEAAADSGFARDADVSTVGGALSLLPVGLTYFFFAPFPWQIGSASRTMAIPETLYFYTLVPGILSGIIYLFRKRLTESVGVLLVTMTVTFGYAIGQGNVGTLYRHKAQVIGFYYAFAAIGMEARRRRPAAARYVPIPPRPPIRNQPAAAFGRPT